MTWRIFFFWLACVSGVAWASSACVSSKLDGKADGGLNGSRGLACEQASDCWDGLPCTDGYCGGKPAEGAEENQMPEEQPQMPEEQPQMPEEQSQMPEESTTTEQDGAPTEPPTESANEAAPCQGNLDAQGFCTQDSDCCTGQTCGSFPFGAQTLRLCTSCTASTECPTNTQCCSFGAVSVCALQCAPPSP
jgi:hypothetical protein